MSLTEFQSIRDYFSKQTVARSDVLLGIGDDCALLSVPQGKYLALSTDTLVAGVHFPEQTAAEDIGYKSLAVSLSDLAAMGAEPAWVSLALSIPQLDETWLADFCNGFFNLAQCYNVQLVGGDTTTGPLVITTQIHGYVAQQQQSLRRSGANPGDLIYVTGNVGEAGLGLLLVQKKLELSSQFAAIKSSLIGRLNRPTPRIEIGLALRDVASAVIDVSDGVAADLNHVLKASAVGARLDVQTLPVSECFPAIADQIGGWAQPLTAGDDFELLFTAPQTKQGEVQQLAGQHQCKITCIGQIEQTPGLKCYLGDEVLKLDSLGYEHFT